VVLVVEPLSSSFSQLVTVSIAPAANINAKMVLLFMAFWFL
jgi:hypothetical protein